MSWKKTKKKIAKSLKRSPALKIFLVLALLAIPAAVYFLLFPPAGPTGEEQKAVCVLLVDRTGSLGDDQQVIDGLMSDAYAVVDQCRTRQARLIVWSFDQNDSRPDSPAGVERNSFELWAPLRNTDAARTKALDEEMQLAREAVRAAFDGEGTGGAGGVESNILLVLKNAAQSLTSLGTESTGDLNVIVISDGMQRSADLSVACLHPQTAIPENGCISVMTTEELLGQAQETGLVPALSGAKIWFVGPLGGRTANGDLYPTGFEDDVNAFWRDVVLEGGGELCFYAATGRVPQSNCGGS